MLVIFEGPDAAGKTSLLRKFNTVTGYSHITVDRLHLSHMVYARYYCRKEFTDLALRTAAASAVKKFVVEEKPLIVFVRADPHVLMKRIRDRGEDPDQEPDPVQVEEIYEEEIRELGIHERLLRLDTSFAPDLEGLARRIEGKVDSLVRG